MDDMNLRLLEVFYEVQRGLPRQGPGDNDSTNKAQALGVISVTEAEIDVRRRFGQSYGYHFFVARKIG